MIGHGGVVRRPREQARGWVDHCEVHISAILSCLVWPLQKRGVGGLRTDRAIPYPGPFVDGNGDGDDTTGGNDESSIEWTVVSRQRG